MKIFVTGGTGFLGRELCQVLSERGHEVVAVSRDAGAAHARLGSSARVVEWTDRWQTAVNEADAIVNLAGEPVAGGRWTPARKERIRASRVETTRSVVAAIERVQHRPAVLVNASAVGYYGPRGDEAVTEDTPAGNDFLARVCVAWEEAARRAASLGTRVVRLRLGVVLGKRGGALQRMRTPFKLFVGGPLGSGTQWVPWIHCDDVTGLIQLALDNPGACGAINATAPNPCTMRTFCETLGKALRRPSWLPLPASVLRLALGEMAQMFLTGQRALPAAAERLGYRFRYATLEQALAAALSREQT
ncbi:MAG: TIGR01777 family oxidoreductase [Candidatus Binatia bacterium]